MFYISYLMRKECLQAIHQGDPGIVKMKLKRAQSGMYCIGLNKEIEHHVMRCKSQQKEPAIPMKIPNGPWKKLGIDLFFIGSKMVNGTC